MTFSSAYFMGVMFSGKMTQARVEKLLDHYLYFSRKNERNIEVAFHPGYAGDDLELIAGSRSSFRKFYVSPWRNIEYENLINKQLAKEKIENAVS